MAQQIIGVAARAVGKKIVSSIQGKKAGEAYAMAAKNKAAMKKKAKSSMTKKSAVAAGASNEYVGSLPKRPGPGQFMSKEKYKASMKEYKKAPALKKAAAKREKAALKSVNKKPVPKRSSSGKASGR